jgi:hypothetical protein
VLWKGRIVESGPAEELFNSDNGHERHRHVQPRAHQHRAAGQRQPLVAKAQHQRDGQRAAGRVAGDGDVRRGDALEHPAVGGHRVVQRRGEGVLGREAVVGDQHPAIRRQRQGATERAVAERRSQHEAAAVQVEHRGRLGGPRGDLQARHAGRGDRAHDDTGRRLEVGEHLLVGGALGVEVLRGDALDDRLPELRDARHELAAERLHGGHGLVDVAEQPACALQ